MHTNQVARIASLVGEPARTAMLLELMDGRALTANELARAAHVTPQTGSRHLAQLVDGGLLVVEQRGRHRYHRLASAEVARVLEGIMQLAAHQPPPVRTVQPGPRNEAMRLARTCYDHVAGRLGVAITQRLLHDGAVVFDGELGWSERRPHLAGRLGRQLCVHCIERGWLRRHSGGRALEITPPGVQALSAWLGAEFSPLGHDT
jgi:DNA-binding transcriptional ArsR family regulator